MAGRRRKIAYLPLLPSGRGKLRDRIYDCLRDAILEGRWRPGMRIPSSRALAEEMSVSRNSILDGFGRLAAEGYLVGKGGAGTYVSGAIPDHLVGVDAPSRGRAGSAPSPSGLSAVARGLLPLWEASRPIVEPRTPFAVGIGPADLFPHDLWGRLLGREWRRSRRPPGGPDDPAGGARLRRAICNYMASTRGLNCTEDQVIVVGGVQQAIALAARVLLDPGDEVWLDEPGYDGARGAFLAAGAEVRPVGGDREGMDVSMGIRLWPRARMAFTAPSHQFPLGGTMSLARRLALLDWAHARRTWIFEDDYNGEFRYAGRPVQALQGLDHHQRVIYAGTFSKMLYPGFRLGFLVVPVGLVRPFLAAKHYADARPSLLEQAVLAEFIEGGYYARHVRRVRRACEQRREALAEALRAHLPGKLEIQPADAGIHLVCWLPGDVDELELVERCRRNGLQVQPLSRYGMAPLPRRGILLGYAAHHPEDLRAAAMRLAQLM